MRRSAARTSQLANRAESVAIEIVRTQRGGGQGRVGSAERESLTHPAAGHDDPIAVERGHDLQQHDRATDHGVGTVGVQARDLRAPLHGLARQIVEDGLQPIGRELVAVQQAEGMLGPMHVDLRQVPNRPPDPDEDLAARQAVDVGGAERFAHVLPHAFQLRGRRRVVFEEPIAHPQRPELEHPRAVQAAVAEPRDLRAPTTDVERRAARDREVVDGADEAEVGLRVAVDDLERNPELPRALEQEVSVERVADGRGGDREDPIGTCPLRDGAEIPERLEGSFDRLRDRARLRYGARAPA